MIALIEFSPLLILMKLVLVDNGCTKERILSHFFKGTSVREFDEICIGFAQSRSSILRSNAMDSINSNLSSGEIAVVLTASITNWVRPFFQNMVVQALGTELESHQGILTGRFKGVNCYGAQKVHCLNRYFPIGSYKILKVYGNSRGDKELLQIADKTFYKNFK